MLVALSCLTALPRAAAAADEPAMVLQTGHSESIGALAFNSARTLLATAASDSQLLIWDVSSGLLVRRFRIPGTGNPSAAGFAGNDQFAFAAGTFGVHVYDISSGRVQWQSDEGAYFAASSPGTDRLVIYRGSARRELDVIDLRTGKRDKPIPIRAANPGALALSADARLVAVGDLDSVPTLTPSGLRNNPGTQRNRVVVYDVATGRPTYELRTESSWVSSVAFSPDGLMLAIASYDKTDRASNTYSLIAVEIVDLTSKTRRAKIAIPLQLSRVSALAFDADSSQLGVGISGNDAGRTNGELMLSDLTGRVSPIASPIGPIWTLAYGSAGVWAGAGRSTHVQLWDANVGEPSMRLVPQSSPATTVAFDRHDAARLTISTKAGQTQVFDLELGITTTVPLHEAVLSGDLVAGRSGLEGNGVYRIEGRNKTVVLTTHRDDFEQTPSLVALDPSGRYFAESLHRYSNKTARVRVWDLAKRTMVFTTERVGPTRTLAVLPHANALLIEDAGGLSVWSLAEAKRLAEVDDRAEWVELYVDLDTSTIQRIVKPSGFDRAAHRSVLVAVTGATAVVERSTGTPERIRKVGPARLVFVPETAYGKQLVAHDWRTGQRVALDYILQDVAGTTYRQDAQGKVTATEDGRPYQGDAELSLPFTRETAVTPDGAFYAEFTHAGDVLLWSLDTGRFAGALAGSGYPITSWMFAADGKRLATATEAGDATIWDLDTHNPVGTLVSLSDGDWMALDGSRRYFFGSRRAELKLAYRLGLRAVPFEQFDLVFNRPDVVLRSFGSAPKARIVAAERAYEARRAAAPLPSGGRQLPTIESLPALTSHHVGGVSTDRAVANFQIQAATPAGLARLHAFNNDAPVVGSNGRVLSGHSAELAIEVPLTVGINEVAISVTDALGVESLRHVTRIMRLGTVESKTYLVAIGVSDYKNPALFLTRAAQDARDVAAAFRTSKGFNGPEPLVLTDGDVTKATIDRIAEFVRGATVDDRLIVYIAGHGTNSPKDGYRFLLPLSSSNDDEHHLSFESLEQMLSSSAPIRKLLFLDTCFAGGAAISSSDSPDVGDEEWRSYDLLDDLVDIRRGSGAVVLAASRGTEVSFDRLPSVDIKHGIFAHAVIESLEDAKADADADGRLRVSELKAYVFDRVDYLSSGMMTPVTRSDNLRNDFFVR